MAGSLASFDPERFGIHAGAYETGILNHIIPQLVHTERAAQLEDNSLTMEQLNLWQEGEERAHGGAPWIRGKSGRICAGL